MKYLSIFVVSLLFISCNMKQKETNKETKQASQTVYSIDELMVVADQMVGKEVTFKGLVNHVCAHSGKRCILKNTKGDLSIRVEAAGELEGFDKEMAGNDIKVAGTLREKRLDEASINEWETEVLEKHKGEEESGHCSSEMTNITEMRTWMKENNKDYYAIYYVDGKSYEVVE